MNDVHTAISAWLENRDQRAARWIVDTHRPMVRRAVSGWLPDGGMIEDVVQETFIKAFRAMPRLVPGSRVEGWLCSIARNTCANALRGWQRSITRSATESGIDDYSEMMVCHDEPPEDPRHRERSIRRLLSRLQEQDRRMLWLFHIEGRSARDVGLHLGLSEGNVRVRMLRSHRALRDEAVQMRSAGLL